MRISLRRKRLLATVALAISIASSGAIARPDSFGDCATKTTAPEAVEDALDGVLQNILKSKLGSAPGGVLSVRTKVWRYIKSAGFANPETGQKMNCEMPFQIGSNTKMMTAVILLQLHEESQLSVDDLLSAHLPKISAKLPNGERITLRQLAQHTSGVFSYTDDTSDGTPGLMEAGTSNPQALRRRITPKEMVQFVMEHGKAAFVPGADGRWSYSNTGYTLLGLVIEKIEKKPIAKSFEQRIFGPLGMRHTYLWNDVPKPAFGLPRSYLAAPFVYETTAWNMSQGWAAGAVISTADDMHVFMEALLSGKLFRSPRTLSIMQTAVRTTNPTLLRYGLGLALKGKNLWGHGGQTLGFESDIAAFQGRGISMVAWGASSKNILSFGAVAISQALIEAGALKD